MRTIVRHGITLIGFATLALACAESRQPQTPASDPKPQAAFNDPKVQAPNDPIANNHNLPQRPIDNPLPQQSQFPSHGPQAPISDPTPQKPFLGGGESTDHAQAKTDKPLSDGEVIGVIIAANDGEVQMAEIALKKATSPEVKQLAGMMKNKHQAALQKDKALEKKTKIAAADSDVSTSLKTEVDSANKDLKAKEGKSFDRAYVDSQVKAHKDVLVIIDNRLLPSATNGELKANLSDMRRTVAGHLVKAEDLQKKLDGGGTSGVGTGKPIEHP